jgi:ubiquinone/menaquinone biosynthesis C-methylase UbiE
MASDKEIRENIKKNIQIYNKYAEVYANYTNQKLLQFQLNKFISMIKKKGKVLDAGCGPGRDCDYFKSEGFSVVGIDIAEGMLKEARRKVQNVVFKKIDMKKLEFEKESFHGIWCVAAFVDISRNDAARVLKEFHKILKKDGILYISTKEGKGERIIKRERYGNEPKLYIFYKQAELEELLKESGFEIVHAITSENDGVQWVEIFSRKIK